MASASTSMLGIDEARERVRTIALGHRMAHERVPLERCAGRVLADDVRAPFDAYVTNLNIAVGQYANQGQEIFALIDDRVWYVMANFRESFLGHIAPGMEADVYLIAYPSRRFRGRVQGVGWGLYQQHGASVGVLPAVEPTLNWVRLAQRFPVRIRLEPPDPERPYRMGATAVVTILGKPADGATASTR